VPTSLSSSSRSSQEREEPLASSTCSSRSSQEREERSSSSCQEREERSASLMSQEQEWSYSLSYVAASGQEKQEDAESCYYSYPGPSPGPSPIPSPPAPGRRVGSTSILLERGEGGDIRSIVRLDSQQPPAILFSRDAEFVCESAVTYHNYTAERREEGCQTEVVGRQEGSSQTAKVVSREEGSQTEEEVVARRRRDSREMALAMAQDELADVVGRLEKAQERGSEQVAEIELLSRRVDQLQRRTAEPKLSLAPGQPGTFIIKDLQSQVQKLEEKNCKKDSLIKKLAETVVRSPGVSVHGVVDNLRTATVKPSDRRIDFDIETLLSFLERRKLSSSLSSSSISGWMHESAPPSLSLRGRQ